MSFVYALKMLCDVAFYFVAASLIGIAAGQSGLVLATPLIIALCAYGCHWLSGNDRKWLKFVPLAGLLLAFVLTKTTTDVVLSVPPMLYLCWYVIRRPNAPAYRDALSTFYLCLKILPMVLIIALIGGQWTGIQEITIPYIFMFLVLSVIELRMLRHDKETIAQLKFKLMNLLGILGVGVAGYLLSSGLMMRVFRFIGACIVNYLLRPVLMLVIYTFAGFMWLLSHLFSGVEVDPSKLDLSQIGENMELGDIRGLLGEAEEGAEAAGSPILDFVLMGIAILALLVIVILIFRALAKHTGHEDENEFKDVREHMDEPLAGERVNRRENRQRVRGYYRKFLKVCVQRGFERTEYQDSLDVQLETRHLFQNREEQARLRDVYVRARYSSDEVSTEDVEAAKESYTKLKKDSM